MKDERIEVDDEMATAKPWGLNDAGIKQVARLQAEIERLRAGGRETSAKLDHTLRAYARLERANADLRREIARLRAVDEAALEEQRAQDRASAESDEWLRRHG